MIKNVKYNVEKLTAELQEANSKLKKIQNLFNQTNDAIVVIDPETGRFLDINNKVSENLGYSRKELLTMRVMDIQTIIPDDHAWQKISKEIRQKGSMYILGEHRRKDGTVFPVEVNAKFVVESTDEYIVSVIRDITARKQAESELQGAQNYLNTMLLNMPVGVAILEGPEFRYFRINQVLADLNGLPVEEHLGKPLEEVLPQAAPGILPNLRKVFENGESILAREFKIRLPSNPGREVNLIDWHFPITVNGKIQAVGAIVMDITERKESEKRFHSVFEESPVAEVIVNETGHIMMVNKEAENTFGYDRDELEGQPIEMLLPKKYRMNHPGQRAGFNATPQSRKMGKGRDLFACHKDGREFPIEVALHPLEIDGKRMVLSVIVNISERKRTEKELEKKRKQLEVSNQELKEFAYIVSHDLKAPLRAINQLSYWIIKDYEDLFDEDGKEQLALLGNRVKRMDSLIDGILEYSRAGKVKGKDETIYFKSLVKDIIENLAAPENIKIKVVNSLPNYVGDKVRFTQVFQNLISNSIKFMDKPIGKINIGCSDEGKYWKFWVEDNGPGIEEKYFDKVFQIFQTLKARDEQEGTGVGLALVKKIITIYRGEVWLESKVGQGTSVFFTLLKRDTDTKLTNHKKQ